MSAATASGAVDQLAADLGNTSLNGGDKPSINTDVSANTAGDEIDTAGPTPSSAQTPHPASSASLYVGELDPSVTEASALFFGEQSIDLEDVFHVYVRGPQTTPQLCLTAPAESIGQPADLPY